MSYGNIIQFQILILEGETGNEISQPSRLEFLEKFLANNFALSYADDNTSGPLNRGDIADLPFLRTLGSDGLFCFSSICKFGSFKNPFAMITCLPELYFTFRKLILLTKTTTTDFYELYKLHKLLKTMKMSEV